MVLGSVLSPDLVLVRRQGAPFCHGPCRRSSKRTEAPPRESPQVREVSLQMQLSLGITPPGGGAAKTQMGGSQRP